MCVLYYQATVSWRPPRPSSAAALNTANRAPAPSSPYLPTGEPTAGRRPLRTHAHALTTANKEETRWLVAHSEPRMLVSNTEALTSMSKSTVSWRSDATRWNSVWFPNTCAGTRSLNVTWTQRRSWTELSTNSYLFMSGAYQQGVQSVDQSERETGGSECHKIPTLHNNTIYSKRTSCQTKYWIIKIH